MKRPAGIIDSKAIRESLDRLDQIAKEHPELLARAGEDCSPEAWEETLKEALPMVGRPKGEDAVSVTVRLPARLVEEICAKAEELRAEGLALSRTGVIRYLLEQSLKPARAPHKTEDGGEER